MKRIFLFVLCYLLGWSSFAQTNTSHLRISLLTCGTGPEVWETFGHTAIRVTDSMLGTDDVYNYGTFNGYDEGFELKFMRGKLLYYLSYYPYFNFIQEYQQSGRSVQEQELLMDDDKKKEFFRYLQWNAREENKYYKYDFFFDNCATRIRDVFPKTYGKEFSFGKTLPDGVHLSFRDIINQYYYRDHFIRFGVNLLLGSRVDKIMTNEDIMFLPDYLAKGIGDGQLNRQPIAAPSVIIVNGSVPLPATTNWIFVITCSILLILCMGYTIPSMKKLGLFMGNLLLLFSGLIGILIMIMWFGTDHQACANNYNLLWALPTNALLAFAPKRKKNKYVLIAIVLLFISLTLHLLHIQQMPLLELSPLLLGLLFTYGMIYRSASLNRS